jgi:hypothetical protein
VALQYIDECRANCPFPDSPVFYSFDGEAQVMNPMLATDLIPLWSQRKVLMVKHAGSTSALCNACDAGNMHKATKTSVKHANEESLMGSISGVEPSIEAAFLQHSSKTAKARRVLVAQMLIQIVAAYKRVLTAGMITKSFVKSGQVIIPSSGFKDFLDSKMAQCTTKMTLQQTQIIRKAFPGLVELAKKNGSISDAEMDEAGIPRHVPDKSLVDKRAKPKDQRPLQNQRTAVVNHGQVLAQFNAYHAARRAKAAASKAAPKRKRKTTGKEVQQSGGSAGDIQQPPQQLQPPNPVQSVTQVQPPVAEGFGYVQCGACGSIFQAPSAAYTCNCPSCDVLLQLKQKK